MDDWLSAEIDDYLRQSDFPDVPNVGQPIADTSRRFVPVLRPSNIPDNPNVVQPDTTKRFQPVSLETVNDFIQQQENKNTNATHA